MALRAMAARPWASRAAALSLQASGARRAASDGAGPKAPGFVPGAKLSDIEQGMLMSAAVEAASAAHAPYSQFRVGAAVLTSEGKIFTGCNVENASYGLTICAERTALVKAVSEGHSDIAAVAVSCPDLPKGAVSSPCGACRQFMAEFGEYEVLMQRDDGIVSTTVDALLPHAFRPDSLPEKK